MRNKYYLAFPVAAAIAVLSLSVASPARAADCELKMGVMGPLSGGAAAWGDAMRLGAEFAAAEANQKGGLKIGADTCHVTVLPYDSKYTVEGAAAGGNYFASQGVNFIIGPVGSPEATGVKPVAERNGQITFNSAYAKDAIGPQWPLAFHQVVGPGTWASPVVAEAKKHFDIKSVVVVAPNDQGGTDIASVDADAYRAQGIEASEEYYQRGTTNFAPIVARMLSKNPDVIDTASSPPADAATMAKQLRQAGFTGPLARLGGPGTAQILNAVGGMKNLGNFYWAEIVPIDDPKVKSLWDDYKKVMGKAAPNNSLFATSVAASRLVLKAISKAGTQKDVNAVRDALRSLPVVDPNLGKGAWTGKETYGIAQEMGFPVGMGMIKDGKNLGVRAIDVTTK